MLHRRSLLTAALLFVGGSSLFACNAITGVDDLVIGDVPSGTGGAGQTSTTGTGIVGVGQGGSSVVSTGAMGTGASPPVDVLVDAAGVSIDEIAIYQGVKRPLMQGGVAASSSIPVVAGRDALMRVFVSTDAGYNGGEVTAQLYLGQGATPIEVKKIIGGASSDSVLGSTVNFDIPGSSLTTGISYRVELKQLSNVSPGDNPASRYPSTGFDPLNAQSSGAQLKLMVVPISYGADGSNRLPDTSAAQIKGYTDAFYSVYPVPNIDVQVHAPVAWSNSVSANGSGWSNLLDGVANLRQQENAPADLYYYGIFAPAASVNQYCSGGCVAGLGFVGSMGDPSTRAAIGLGFTGDIAFETAIHEVGHNHGRQHSPCGGAQGTDPNFPYSGAGIGVWGYDLLGKKLFNPNQNKDMMGYCSPIWISDYTYNKLFERIKFVNNAKIVYPPELLDRVYDRARIEMDGSLIWLSSTKLHTPPEGEPQTITVQSPSGSSSVVAQFHAYDHLPGGVLVWPQAGAPSTAITVQYEGKTLSLTR